MSWFGWACAGAAIACLLACNLGEDPVACNSYAAAALDVTVVNGASPDGECATTVKVTDGSFSETLACHAEGTACRCYGPYERPGTYTVRATKNGGGSAETTASVHENECHVETVEVTLSP